jgi:beta-propeller repeat-containing protein/Big-like domain-containing protein
VPTSLKNLFITVLAAFIAMPSISAQQQSRQPGPVVLNAKTQLYFEPAAPSPAAPARFISRSRGYNIFLADDAIVIGLTSRRNFSALQTVSSTEPEKAVALRMRFKGANAHPQIEAEQPLQGVSNYLIGRDPASWRLGVHHFARVRYHNLYPGVDLLLYGSAGRLEYDLVVHPGADTSKIAFLIDGAKSTRVDRKGNLVIHTELGDLRQAPTTAYSLAAGKKTPAKVEYAKLGPNEVGFHIIKRHSNSTLVIDPVLRYSTMIGSTGFDAGEAIAVDSTNHAYITGLAGAADFPTTAGVFQRTSSSPVAFVSKFAFDGSSLIYSTFIGGTSGRTVSFGIKVNSAGNAFVTGFTEAPDFPTTAGAFQSGLRGTNDVFVTELSPAGAHLVYSTLLGGSAGDLAEGLALDSAGNAYITGSTESTDFPTTPAAISRTLNGLSDVFITKLNSTGTNVVYSSYLGGSKDEIGDGIALDSANNAYITGNTTSPDFPVTAGAPQTKFGGGTEGGDYFATKVNAGGTAIVYSTYIGGTSDEGTEGRGGIAVDGSGNAYITGDTFSADFPTTPGAFQPSGACGPFVTKVNAAGTAFAYSTRLTGSDGDCQAGHGIAVDGSGNAYVIGTTGSTDFPVREPFDARLNGPFVDQGQHDAFVSKLNPGGSALLWSSYFGGTGFADEGTAITLDRDRNVYVTGTASSSDFPTTQNAFQKTAHDAAEAFVAKIIPLCALSTINPSATLCSPASGSTVTSPVKIIAGTTDSTPVKLLQVYVDGAKKYEAALAAAYVTLSLPPGSHRITAQAIDTSNRIFKKSVTVTVR